MNTEEFEYSVIGAICIDDRVIEKISGLVDAEDFSIIACADVYEAAVDSMRRGKSFDPIYASDVVSNRIVDAKGFIMECMSLCPSCTNAVYHAKEIHKRAQMRNLNSNIGELLMVGTLDNSDPNDIAAEITGICQDYLTRGKTGKGKTMAEALGQVYNRATSEINEERVDTGFTRLDSMLKGMPSGNLIFIGARPSVGKSAFAMSIAEHSARANGRTLLYSLEMLADEYAERAVSKASGISMDNLIDCKVPETQYRALAETCGRLSELPLTIFDTPNISPSDIRRDARRFNDLKLIVIDYISLMGSDKKFTNNRNLELGQISRDLKNLAVELKVPIVCLSQLSRNKDEKTEPNLMDLRDSGELEQNANKVIFLWQIDKFDDGTKEVGVSVAKNRRGRLGAVRMEFDGSHMRFEEIDFYTETAKPSKKYGNGVDV